jgi:hypothetical protein
MIVNTNSNGVATWTYTDKSLHGGPDNIRVWIDKDGSGSFDESNDSCVVLREFWLDNFVTASGNIMDGTRIIWTFGGSVGMLGREIVGDFELVDHVRKITYLSNNFLSSNAFFPLNAPGSPSSSIPASSKTAMFNGVFTNNRDASKINLAIWMVDAGDPGANIDKISVKTGLGEVPGSVWIGTPNPDWTPPPPSYPYALPFPISNGNIQMHKTS